MLCAIKPGSLVGIPAGTPNHLSMAVNTNNGGIFSGSTSEIVLYRTKSGAVTIVARETDVDTDTTTSDDADDQIRSKPAIVSLSMVYDLALRYQPPGSSPSHCTSNDEIFGLYACDRNNNFIRVLTPPDPTRTKHDGGRWKSSIVCGNGHPKNVDGPALQASLWYPQCFAFDRTDGSQLLIGCHEAFRILNFNTSMVTTVPTALSLPDPSGMVITKQNIALVTDWNGSVYAIHVKSGQCMELIAAHGTVAFPSVSLYAPVGIVLDDNSLETSVVICDQSQLPIKRISGLPHEWFE